MLVGLREILDIAEKKSVCIPAFNVYNFETVKGVMRAAEKMRSPVILQIYSRLVTNGAAEGLLEGEMMRRIARLYGEEPKGVNR